MSTYSIVYMLQGRHTKTGQLAAIKVMSVTEVSYDRCHCDVTAFNEATSM